MKKTLIVSFLIAAILSVTLWATLVEDSTVYMRETKFGVVYSGTISFAAGGTDSVATQAMFITDCNRQLAFASAWTNTVASDDVNFHVEYSNDRDTWRAGLVAAGLIFEDLNGGTAQADTVDVTAGVRDPLYNNSKWMRFVAIGQSGNGTTVRVAWTLSLLKNSTANGSKKYGLKFRVKNDAS